MFPDEGDLIAVLERRQTAKQGLGMSLVGPVSDWEWMWIINKIR